MKKLILFLLGCAIGIGASYYFNSQNQTEESMAKPKGVITPAEAKVLDAAFNSRHQLISDSIVKRPDNRSSWWSLKDMRDYLTYAENQAKDQGYTMDGVRVYLGAYPDTSGQVGYTTLFMVPTGTKGVAEGSMVPLPNMQGGSPDLPNGDGLNKANGGVPPGANYPQ